jgi:hypothetical protein
MSLVKKGNRLYLKFDRAVKGLWVGERRKNEKPIGKGEFIEVIPSLEGTKGEKLTFVVLEDTGSTFAREMSVSKYRYLVKAMFLRLEEIQRELTLHRRPGGTNFITAER